MEVIIPCSVIGETMETEIIIPFPSAIYPADEQDSRAKIAKIPVFFPVSREFDPETGSLQTPSTAIESLNVALLY